MISKIVISLLIGYVFGIFQTSFFLGKIYHKDVRKFGSNNLGATNVMRVLGKKAGTITFLVDALKGFFSCLVISLIFKSYVDIVFLLQIYAIFGVVIGHCFPCYLKFNGGKGISSFVGAMFYISPIIALLGLIIFFMIVKITKYVSAGSLFMSFIFMTYLCISTAISYEWVIFPYTVHVMIISVILYIIIVLRHWGNIVRIANKEERKIR